MDPHHTMSLEEISGPSTPPAGKRLKLPGLQWARAERNLPGCARTAGTWQQPPGPLQQMVIRLGLCKALETPSA